MRDPGSCSRYLSAGYRPEATKCQSYNLDTGSSEWADQGEAKYSLHRCEEHEVRDDDAARRRDRLEREFRRQTRLRRRSPSSVDHSRRSLSFHIAQAYPLRGSGVISTCA